MAKAAMTSTLPANRTSEAAGNRKPFEYTESCIKLPANNR